MTARTLDVGGLSKRFTLPGGDVVAVDNVTFKVEEAEFFTMLGPSGSGAISVLLKSMEKLVPVSDSMPFDGNSSCAGCILLTSCELFTSVNLLGLLLISMLRGVSM